MSHFPTTRLRRLRHNANIRDLAKEIQLNLGDLVAPLFIRHGSGAKKAIASMPGHYQLTTAHLAEEINSLQALGIKNVLLFGIPEYKDPLGQDAYSSTGIIQSAIREIKKVSPSMLVISDVCFCEYTDHGHCGVMLEKNTCLDLDNDQTLELLVKQAVSHAQAGADILAPSGMIDGMVQAIRRGLDAADFQHLPILSYSVKYASSMYGPFREAAEGAPKFGNRHSYQMDFSNRHESLRECELDVNEGADMLMVKPAHTYLDIITRVKQAYPALPLGAYHTSGEYAMIKAAAANGWLDERSAAIEVLTAIRRAGADFIVTYYAKSVAEWLKEGK